MPCLPAPEHLPHSQRLYHAGITLAATPSSPCFDQPTHADCKIDFPVNIQVGGAAAAAWSTGWRRERAQAGAAQTPPSGIPDCLCPGLLPPPLLLPLCRERLADPLVAQRPAPVGQLAGCRAVPARGRVGEVMSQRRRERGSRTQLGAGQACNLTRPPGTRCSACSPWPGLRGGQAMEAAI